jgi:hypothetical protein
MIAILQFITMLIHAIIVYNLVYETIQAWHRRVNHYNSR